MKLVIDLPDEVVKWFKVKGFIPIGQYLMVDEAMKKAEPLSEILDKISAEIEKLDGGITSYHNDKPWVYKSEVLDIIEKYKGVSE